MRRAKIVAVILVGVIAVGFVAGPALGQTCDNTFNETTDNRWQTLANWSLNRPPNATEVACIPADEKCVIEFDPFIYDAHAKAIVISADATNTGELEIDWAQTLTIYEDSTIDGLLTLVDGAKLYIDDDLTITGNGGEINRHTGERGLIDHADGEDFATLTIASATPGARDTSLVVHGSLTIAVRLTNRAYVVAADGELVLTGPTKWGHITGHWIAEEKGHMIVNSHVWGTAPWLIHEDVTASITIQYPCRLLTGTFDMTDGVFHVEEDFQTTGNVTVKSIDNGQYITEPKIVVRQDAEVSFGS